MLGAVNGMLVHEAVQFGAVRLVSNAIGGVAKQAFSSNAYRLSLVAPKRFLNACCQTWPLTVFGLRAS